MRRGTRMMAISSLGEDRRMEGDERSYSYDERAGHNYPDNNYEGGYERQYPPHSYGGQRMMSPRRREEYAREMGEDRRSEREEMERQRRQKEPRNRYMGYSGRNGADHDARGGSMYGDKPRMMGFGSEEDEDDWEGRFRPGQAQGHHSEEEQELTEDRVKKWVQGMHNEDNTRGAHFGMDRAELLRSAQCPDGDKLEFYAAINMIYSDYCGVAKEMGVDKPEYYAKMAKAFLMDKDAGKGKLEKYMRCIAGK